MEKKYLLYIDTLGFADLVEDEMKVRRLYHIIENLNAHIHDSFRVIVFSDTILIYNAVEPIDDKDHRYLVMFLIEFVQDLLYRIIGKGYFFRAVLIYGEFEHTKTNIEKFFGKALVDAYQKEKSINCTGLFIDNICQKYNSIFRVERYDKEFSFVFLNQSIERVIRDYGPLPIDPEFLFDTDYEWFLVRDVQMLKDIYTIMRTHKDPKVRKKMFATWKFYCKRYPDFVKKLIKSKFNLNVISNSPKWKKFTKSIRDGYRGYGVKVPTIEQFRKVINKARKAGRLAARKKYLEIHGSIESVPKFIAPCGGAMVVLDIDNRSLLGRFLLHLKTDTLKISIERARYFGGIILSIYGMHSWQERVVDEAAEQAAFEIIKKELNVDGYIHSYYS